MPKKLSTPERDHAAQVIAIFSALVHAALTNDFHRAAQAKDDLKRLGYDVAVRKREIAEVSS